MPTPSPCPHCGARPDVDEAIAGNAHTCDSCGKTFTILPPLEKAPPKPSRAWLVLIALAGLAIVGIIVAGVQSTRKGARIRCRNNLLQIGAAMHSYHDTFGVFPPAYIPDEDGRPMHSWRVLLIPFFGGHPPLYDFNNSWDSPESLAWADAVASEAAVYGCPAESGHRSKKTSYMVVSGPGMVFDGPNSSRLADIHDGPSKTIMVVEVCGSSLTWNEPRDLDAAQLTFVIGPNGEIDSRHPQVVNALFCDGSVRPLDRSLSPQMVKAMLTKAGGEPASVSAR